MNTKFVISSEFKVEYSVEIDIYFSLAETNEDPFTKDLDKAFVFDTEAEANRMLDLLDINFGLRERGFVVTTIPYPNKAIIRSAQDV